MSHLAVNGRVQDHEDKSGHRAENPSWMDQEEAPADILKQMAGGKGKQTYAVQGWQLSRW